MKSSRCITRFVLVCAVYVSSFCNIGMGDESVPSAEADYYAQYYQDYYNQQLAGKINLHTNFFCTKPGIKLNSTDMKH